MVRVLHVVHTMECGGIETMLMNIYRKTDRNQIQFDFLVNGKGEQYYSREIRSLGGNIYQVTPKRVNVLKNIRETCAVMKKGGYRIVHIHQDSMIAAAVWCAERAGVKMIITHAHTTSANGWHRKLFAVAARTYISKHASVKLACSGAAARWIYGNNKMDIILFKNAIDAEAFRYDREETMKNRKALGIKPGQFAVGTCGRLSAEKNQMYLIDIFYEIKKIKKDAVLLIVGDGEERQKLQRKAEKLEIAEDVLFTGMVDNVGFYYSIMDCFILPSVFEGLPLAGIEAQAAGIPSFFSNGVTREVKITPDVYFEDISVNPGVWAEGVIKHCGQKKDTLGLIRKSGYDIGENVRMLQQLYLSGQTARDGGSV